MNLKLVLSAISLCFFTNSIFSQKEHMERIRICENECVEIGIKKRKGSKYEWKAFGENLTSSSSKIKVCPKNRKNLYYVTVTDKKGIHIETYKYQILVNELDVEIEPKNLCILDNKELTIKVVGDFDEYSWSNGETSDSIIVNEPMTLELKVKNEKGCEGSRTVQVTQKKSNDIKNYVEKKGFYSAPIKIKDKKKKKN